MKANEFGAYIKSLRKQAHMTIRQVETYSGVSNGYLSQLENGKRDIPSPEILRKLSKPLKIPYEDLMVAAGYLDETEITKESPGTDLDKDPEWAQLYEEVRRVGAELEAETLLRSVAQGKVSKNALRDLLRAYNIIQKDDE